MYHNVGSLNEAGILRNLYRKGFSLDNCLCELIANSIDARAKNIILKIENEKIKLIDDGRGMNIENIKNMFDINRENHSNEKTMGVSGLGGKPATLILSKETEVVIYTHKLDNEKYLKIIVPWNEIMNEGIYTGKIKIDDMNEDEINNFENDRLNFNIKRGTTIEFKYNDDLNQLIQKNFMIKSGVDFLPNNRLSVVFGKFDTHIFLNDINEKNFIELKKYDYFCGNDNQYYKGIDVQTIEHYYTNGKDRFIWYNTDDFNNAYEFKPYGKIGFKQKVERTNVPDEECYVGEYLIKTCVRKNNDFFNIDEPSGISGETYSTDYEENILGSAKGDIELFKFYSKTNVIRNNQFIDGIELAEFKISNARSSAESKFSVFYVRTEIVYEPISTVENRQDFIIGIQENKNQLNSNNLPLNFTRLVSHIKQRKVDEVLQYFNDLIKEKLKNNSSSKKVDDNIESNEDESNEDVSNEDESNENELNEDESNKDKSNEDKSNEDESNKNKSIEKKLNEVEFNEDESNEDESNEVKSNEVKSNGEEFNEDESNEEEFNEDESNEVKSIDESRNIIEDNIIFDSDIINSVETNEDNNIFESVESSDDKKVSSYDDEVVVINFNNYTSGIELKTKIIKILEKIDENKNYSNDKLKIIDELLLSL